MGNSKEIKINLYYFNKMSEMYSHILRYKHSQRT